MYSRCKEKTLFIPTKETLYQMSPVELLELKSQLEDFLAKRFIWMSVSACVAPFLLVKNKDCGMHL